MEQEYTTSILESMLDAVIVANPDGTINMVNRAALELLGYTEEELIGQSVGTIFEEEEEEEEEEAFFRGTGLAQLVCEGAARDVELTLRAKSGERILVLFNGSIIREEDGRLAAVVGVARDIRERKRAEEEIKHRSAELASLNRASQAITASLDLQRVLSQIVDLAGSVVNAVYTSVVLLTEDGSLGLSAENFREGAPIQVRARPQGITHQIIASRQPMVFDEVLDDGTHNPALVAAGVRSYVGLPLMVKEKVLGVLFVHSHAPGAFRNRLPLLTTFANQAAITIENARLYDAVQQELAERKRAEEALRESEERYRSLFDGVPVGLYRTTVAGQFLDANPALAKMLGYPDRESLLAANAVDMYVDSEDRQRWQALMEREGVMRASEVQWRCYDGTVIWVQESAHAVRGTDGRVLYYEGGVENITGRKRAEEEMHASEQRYRLLFERNLAGVYRTTLDGHIVDCNESYARMFGCDSQEEALALRASELYFDAADREKFITQLQEQGALTNSEWCLRRKDGSPVWVLENASLIEGEEGAPPFIQGTLVDITQRKRAERLLQALNQAALAMERALTQKEIFTAVARELKKLGFSCLVFLMDESQSRLLTRYVSYEARAIKALEKLTGLKIEDFSIPIETTDVYRKVVWERKAAFIENVEDVTRQLLPKPLKKFTGHIIRMLKIAKSIPAPLIVEDKVIGLLSVESDDLTEDDVPAITAFAHQMAAAWRKATLLQDLERSLAEVERAREELQHTLEKLREALGGIIQTVAFTVETKDPYTAGHQRRVTNLARAIADEMGLPEEQIDGIRMAGLIHDLGKVGVPTEILSKPGPLSDLQYGLIQAHSQIGYDILKTVDFPWPVAQIVLQHHERMDGSGYPQGLSGEEIMLEARILAVADVVEAMASFRPYRPALGTDKALEEISQNTGILYDAEVVDACLKLFAEKEFKFE